MFGGFAMSVLCTSYSEYVSHEREYVSHEREYVSHERPRYIK